MGKNKNESLSDNEKVVFMEGINMIMDNSGLEIDKSEIVNMVENKNIKPDIVILKKESIFIKIFKTLLLLPAIVIIIGLIIGIIYMSKYNIVRSDTNIVGQTAKFGGFAIMNKDFVASTTDIKEGSKIIYKKDNKTGFIGPLLLNINEAEVVKIDKLQVQIREPEDKSIKNISMFDVMYIKER